MVWAQGRCQAVRSAHEAFIVTWMLSTTLHHGGLASPINIL
jgi:hypothetical protein